MHANAHIFEVMIVTMKMTMTTTATMMIKTCLVSFVFMNAYKGANYAGEENFHNNYGEGDDNDASIAKKYYCSEDKI